MIKFLLSSSLFVGVVMLFGFEVQSVDLTQEGIEKEALPYTIAKDGKKIYKDIGKTIEALNGQTIKALKAQDIKSMRVTLIYPVDSNVSQKKSLTPLQTEERVETKAQEDITNVFANLNSHNQAKTEEINKENQKVELDEQIVKAKPVNLEK